MNSEKHHHLEDYEILFFLLFIIKYSLKAFVSDKFFFFFSNSYKVSVCNIIIILSLSVKQTWPQHLHALN